MEKLLSMTDMMPGAGHHRTLTAAGDVVDCDSEALDGVVGKAGDTVGGF